MKHTHPASFFENPRVYQFTFRQRPNTKLKRHGAIRRIGQRKFAVRAISIKLDPEILLSDTHALFSYYALSAFGQRIALRALPLMQFTQPGFGYGELKVSGVTRREITAGIVGIDDHPLFRRHAPTLATRAQGGRGFTLTIALIGVEQIHAPTKKHKTPARPKSKAQKKTEPRR